MSGQLDAVIHPMHRLKVCAMLESAGSVEMSVIRDAVGLSPSALSKQVGALVDAGYVRQERSRGDSRRIWLTLTDEGRNAYRCHVTALREIVATQATSAEAGSPQQP
ncbi:MarR family transcriptional regulator [Microbacterium sp. dk485]|uniref:transcriptional regulator n=1 Tax=Microbacterium TaxID=33882 RepID=UPI001073321C|nr:MULTISPECIES: transcriptional regulator [Microbacterium]TFV82074.1 MarR family transcriptional regulator [Microbacterium sp. dk485]TXK20599.1 helix-turn-helix domain-containing protein [Microbacterium wangchenii]